jgi:hypothetical protein
MLIFPVRYISILKIQNIMHIGDMCLNDILKFFGFYRMTLNIFYNSKDIILSICIFYLSLFVSIQTSKLACLKCYVIR